MAGPQDLAGLLMGWGGEEEVTPYSGIRRWSERKTKSTAGQIGLQMALDPLVLGSLVGAGALRFGPKMLNALYRRALGTDIVPKNLAPNMVRAFRTQAHTPEELTTLAETLAQAESKVPAAKNQLATAEWKLQNLSAQQAALLQQGRAGELSNLPPTTPTEHALPILQVNDLQYEVGVAKNALEMARKTGRTYTPPQSSLAQEMAALQETQQQIVKTPRGTLAEQVAADPYDIPGGLLTGEQQALVEATGPGVHSTVRNLGLRSEVPHRVNPGQTVEHPLGLGEVLRIGQPTGPTLPAGTNPTMARPAVGHLARLTNAMGLTDIAPDVYNSAMRQDAFTTGGTARGLLDVKPEQVVDLNTPEGLAQWQQAQAYAEERVSQHKTPSVDKEWVPKKAGYVVTDYRGREPQITGTSPAPATYQNALQQLEGRTEIPTRGLAAAIAGGETLRDPGLYRQEDIVQLTNILKNKQLSDTEAADAIYKAKGGLTAGPVRDIVQALDQDLQQSMELMSRRGRLPKQTTTTTMAETITTAAATNAPLSDARKESLRRGNGTLRSWTDAEELGTKGYFQHIDRALLPYELRKYPRRRAREIQKLLTTPDPTEAQLKKLAEATSGTPLVDELTPAVEAPVRVPHEPAATGDLRKNLFLAQQNHTAAEQAFQAWKTEQARWLEQKRSGTKFTPTQLRAHEEQQSRVIADLYRAKKQLSAAERAIKGRDTSLADVLRLAEQAQAAEDWSINEALSIKRAKQLGLGPEFKLDQSGYRGPGMQGDVGQATPELTAPKIKQARLVRVFQHLQGAPPEMIDKVVRHVEKQYGENMVKQVRLIAQGQLGLPQPPTKVVPELAKYFTDPGIRTYTTESPKWAKVKKVKEPEQDFLINPVASSNVTKSALAAWLTQNRSAAIDALEKLARERAAGEARKKVEIAAVKHKALLEALADMGKTAVKSGDNIYTSGEGKGTLLAPNIGFDETIGRKPALAALLGVPMGAGKKYRQIREEERNP